MPAPVKIVVGLVVVLAIVVGGLVALLSGSFTKDEGPEPQNRTAITPAQFRKIKVGSSRLRVERRLGRPGRPLQFEGRGLPTEAIRVGCIYYNEYGKALEEGRFFRLCFKGNRLVSKRAFRSRPS